MGLKCDYVSHGGKHVSEACTQTARTMQVVQEDLGVGVRPCTYLLPLGEPPGVLAVMG
ncbi:MAG: hypothetical protein ACPLPR_09325 [Bacillota bacterium]